MGAQTKCCDCNFYETILGLLHYNPVPFILSGLSKEITVIPRLLFLFCLIWAGILDSSVAQLASYKATVVSFVYEDGSLSRRVTLNYSIDEKDAALAKRSFFTANGYTVHDYADEGNYFLIAERVKSPDQPSLEDAFSRTELTIEDRRINWVDKFSTEFIRRDIENSDLKDNLATAKVMLADLEYSFYAVFPGHITESSSGEIQGDTTVWHYDVEQLLHHDHFEMSASSTVDRQDSLIWYVFLIGVLLVTIGILLFVKTQINRRASPTDEKAVA